MEEWKSRVIIESDELNEKIVKLTSFLHSSKSKIVSASHRALMEDQLYIMLHYSGVLLKRIQS